MNAKVSVFFICVEAVIYLSLNNLDNSTLKINETICPQNHYETHSFKNHTIQAPRKMCGFVLVMLFSFTDITMKHKMTEK